LREQQELRTSPFRPDSRKEACPLRLFRTASSKLTLPVRPYRSTLRVMGKKSIRCPHCGDTVSDSRSYRCFEADDGYWFTHWMLCPSCDEVILYIVQASVLKSGEPSGTILQEFLAWPRTGNRPPAPAGVPEDLSNDYNEACLVLELSPKAAAAMGRRCLQNLLRSVLKTKLGSLFEEIEAVLARGELPSHIADDLHFLREVGNFAAHATRDVHSGEVLDVEPGEAEAVLDVLLSLFDFHYVAPAKSEARRKALRAKLGKSDVGAVE